MTDSTPTDAASSHRLRFAPSPTGFLHVGGARTALFNWLFVRKYGGAFLLRIEDTDKARSTDESTRAIFDGLRWLGLDWDEPAVYQGANVARHRSDALRLLAEGKAYRCFCTTADLDERRKAAESQGAAFVYDRRCDRLPVDEIDRRIAAGVPFTIRFRVPDGTTRWDDMVRGEIAFPNADVDDLIILRSDGTPIYNLAVVSDDIAQRITLVMRGEDHISNTPKQILLYEALGAPLPRFAHLPNILGADGKKLSKRHGATAVGDYEHLGILAEAMVNFLALLGWSAGDDREVMPRADLIALFSTEGLLRKPGVFDVKKLEWMNGQHLGMTSAEVLEPLLSPLAVSQGLATAVELATRRAWWLQLIDLLRIRGRTTVEIVRMAVPYFRDDFEYDPDAVAKQWKDRDATARLLEAVRSRLAGSGWDPVELERDLRALADELGIGAGKLLQPLRVALVGSSASPGIFDVLVLLGRERSLRRVDRALTMLAEAD
ncbi:MAG: Glutamate--tRNA ligase [Gemmatimonadaceae bacterium]|nr:Glutamate--tRNA ligase [Gemmatimonadaceae bacterium]